MPEKSNSPAPLNYQLVPLPVRAQSPIVMDTWRLLAQRLAERGANGDTISNMREAYASGLYAASAAITCERATAQAISEAAFRIEKLR